MPRLLILAALLLLVPTAHAQFGAESLPNLTGIATAIAETTRPPEAASGAFGSGLDVPRVDPGETASEIARQIRLGVEAEAGPQPALAQLEAQMPTVLSGLEGQLEGIGFAPRDFGVAVAYAFIYLWETAQNEVIPEEPSMRSARTVAAVTGEYWGPSFRAMSAAQQEKAYETLLISTTLLNAFAQQFSAAGQTAEAREMRSAAATIFESLFGTAPSAVRVDASGLISGLASSGITEASGDVPTPEATRPPPSISASGGSLPAADLNGAEVYIKYTWGYGINGFIADQEPLILFPDGSAFEDMPEGGVTTFTPEAIRAAMDEDDRRRDAGTWQRDGPRRILLTVDGETRTLRRSARGWWDDDDPIDEETGYDTYFPVVLASMEHMLGPWETSSLFISGTFGGPLPQVSGGSSTDRVFYADGTFSEDRESFVSATDANVGGAYGGGGTFSLFDENQGQSAGLWRVDGPLMTLERNGERRIVLAFILPEWSQDNPNSDVWVGRDFWERPESE